MSAKVVCVGPHILDVLVRPVTEIPAGQGGLLLDDARLTAAGTAAGTAVDLAKLGAQVTSVGAIGDDPTGRFLRLLLDDHGVATGGLAVKRGERTATTILPIRPNGERPTLHLSGAGAMLTRDDVDWDAVAEADALHVGGPDSLGPFTAEVVPELLAFAREHGTTTSVDLLRTRIPADLIDQLATCWPLVDHFTPNDDQLRALTGESDLLEGARRMRDAGVGTVIVTRGGEGALIVADGLVEQVDAIPCDVVDTTGCGDAFTAGLIVGLHRGWDVVDAAGLATAAAGLVAQGLGSDAGIVDLAGTVDHWRRGFAGRIRPLPDLVLD